MERPITDQFDILPTDHFSVRGVQLCVARRDVDHFRCVEADRFRDHCAPTLAERALDNTQVGPGRARADDEWIRELEAVYGGGESWHDEWVVKQLPCVGNACERLRAGSGDA